MDDVKMDRESGSEDTLGARLRKAREYKGLDLDDVAHQLNLNQQRISDMENDDYRFAVAESYAKGYLRMYAKLLGLDPDLIAIEFDRMKFGDNIQHHRTKLILKRQITANDRWMRWLTYSIGAVLVFLVAIWWRSQPSHADDQSTTEVSAQVAPKTDPNLSEEATVLQNPAAIDLNSNSVPSSASTSVPVQNDSQKTVIVSPSDPTGIDKTQNATATTAPAPQKPANSQVLPSANATNAVGKSPQVSAPATTTPAPSTSTTNSASNTTNQNTAVAPKADPNAAEDDSDDESDDDSEDDSTNNVQGFNIFKKLTKPKVLVGQRERDEQALLRELEKVFGRG